MIGSKAMERRALLFEHSGMDAPIRILVIDEDKLIRWSLKEMFTREGYEVNTFASVENVLQEAINTRYDLIIADLNLKVNKEIGIEMLGKIKKAHPSTPMVILSTRAKHQIDLQLSNLNIHSVVEKPFLIEKITAIAKKALAS